MELFVSQPDTPLNVALDELQMSDAVVIIIGFKAGSLIPNDPSLTYTAAKFQGARELGRHILVFLKTDSGAWRNEEVAPDLREALDKFKETVLDSGATEMLSRFQATTPHARTGVILDTVATTPRNKREKLWPNRSRFACLG
jgi:hypothetical protein